MNKKEWSQRRFVTMGSFYMSISAIRRVKNSEFFTKQEREQFAAILSQLVVLANSFTSRCKNHETFVAAMEKHE